MAGDYNSGLVSATIVQNITGGSSVFTTPGIPSGATRITATTAGLGTTYTTYYTVTAGKTLYITDVFASNYGGSGNVFIGASGTDKWIIGGSSPGGASESFLTPLVFTAGQTVQAKLGAGGTGGTFSFSGFEL